MKIVFQILSIVGLIVLTGCQSNQVETMVLLDEKIDKVHIAKSEGFGGMNEELLRTYTDDESIKTIKKAITTAQKQPGKVESSKPEYDVMVEYTSKEGKLPTHALHLWLGNDNEESIFMYLEDDEVYLTSSQMTRKLRMLIPTEE